MKSKIFNIPIIGDISVYKHHKSKRITLKIKPNELPSVVIPMQMPYRMGVLFATEKTEWILQTQQKIKNKKKFPTIIDENVKIPTHFATINIIRKAEKIKLEKVDNNINIIIPSSYDIKNDDNQIIIRKIIVDILRIEAKKYLPQRVDLLAKKFGFKYNQLFIKNLKSRWGSCSAINNINLNLHIMRLPEYLSDFIILHELCHTVHKNHGKEFHKLLNTICGGKEKIYNNEIKLYNPTDI